MEYETLEKPKSKIKVGDYSVKVYKKGYNENAIESLNMNGKWKDRDVFYQVRLNKEDWFDVCTQEEAEIISRLVRIENKLNKVNKW